MDEINVSEPEKRNRNIKKFVDKNGNVAMVIDGLRGKGKNIKLDNAGRYAIDNAIRNGLEPEDLIDQMIKFDDLTEKGRRKNTVKEYVQAIEFVSYIVGGLSYSEAYKKTFPMRVKGKDAKAVSSAASQYTAGSLVSGMLNRVYLNQHVFFIDKTIQAKLELFNLGMTAEYDKDRVNALDKFLTHTAKYEEKTGAVINNFTQVGSVNIVNAIDEKLKKLAEVAQNQIEEGVVDAKVIAEGGIKVNDE